MRKNFEQAYINIALRRLSSISKKLSDDFQALRDAHEADTKQLEAENARLKEALDDSKKREEEFYKAFCKEQLRYQKEHNARIECQDRITELEAENAKLKSQVADIADIAKELSTELDVFAHAMGDDLSLMRLTQTADIVIAKVKDEPIPDFGIETVYACEECNDGYVQAGRCCNECGVVFVLPGREI